MKLGIVGGWIVAQQDGDAYLQAPSYVAAREKAAAFARRLGPEAAFVPLCMASLALQRSRC